MGICSGVAIEDFSPNGSLLPVTALWKASRTCRVAARVAFALERHAFLFLMMCRPLRFGYRSCGIGRLRAEAARVRLCPLWCFARFSANRLMSGHHQQPFDDAPISGRNRRASVQPEEWARPRASSMAAKLHLAGRPPRDEMALPSLGFFATSRRPLRRDVGGVYVQRESWWSRRRS